MILKGRYYMHEKAADVCVLVISDAGSGTYEVQWWNLGTVGTPSPVDNYTDFIYMHPTVWKDITEYLKEPREQWS